LEPSPAGGHVLSEVRITVHTSTQLAGGQNPTPYRAGLQLALTWSATAAEVSRVGGGAPNSDAVRRILTSMGQWSDAFGVPRFRARRR
jgi:hypothetical protein